MTEVTEPDWWMTEAEVEAFWFCSDDAGKSGSPVTDIEHLPIPERIGNHFILGINFKDNGKPCHRSRIMMMPVESSNITHVGYDSQLKHLIVLFKNSSIYMYSDIDYDQACGIMNSQSVGKFLNSNIKDGKEYRKLLS